MKFTNRTRTTVKLSFVKFSTVKYNIRENTNREIIINIYVLYSIYYVYILIIVTLIYYSMYLYVSVTKYVNKYKYYKNIHVIDVKYS